MEEITDEWVQEYALTTLGVGLPLKAERYLQRARDIVAQGKLKNCIQRDGIVAAVCKGSGTESYAVTVRSAGPDHVTTTCTCPSRPRDGTCKHALAMLLWLAANKQYLQQAASNTPPQQHTTSVGNTASAHSLAGSNTGVANRASPLAALAGHSAASMQHTRSQLGSAAAPAEGLPSAYLDAPMQLLSPPHDLPARPVKRALPLSLTQQPASKRKRGLPASMTHQTPPSASQHARSSEHHDSRPAGPQKPALTSSDIASAGDAGPGKGPTGGAASPEIQQGAAAASEHRRRQSDRDEPIQQQQRPQKRQNKPRRRVAAIKPPLQFVRTTQHHRHHQQQQASHTTGATVAVDRPAVTQVAAAATPMPSQNDNKAHYPVHVSAAAPQLATARARQSANHKAAPHQGAVSIISTADTKLPATAAAPANDRPAGSKRQQQVLDRKQFSCAAPAWMLSGEQMLAVNDHQLVEQCRKVLQLFGRQAAAQPQQQQQQLEGRTQPAPAHGLAVQNGCKRSIDGAVKAGQAERHGQLSRDNKAGLQKAKAIGLRPVTAAAAAVSQDSAEPTVLAGKQSSPPQLQQQQHLQQGETGTQPLSQVETPTTVLKRLMADLQPAAWKAATAEPLPSAASRASLAASASTVPVAAAVVQQRNSSHPAANRPSLFSRLMNL